MAEPVLESWPRLLAPIFSPPPSLTLEATGPASAHNPGNYPLGHSLCWSGQMWGEARESLGSNLWAAWAGHSGPRVLDYGLEVWRDHGFLAISKVRSRKVKFDGSIACLDSFDPKPMEKRCLPVSVIFSFSLDCFSGGCSPNSAQGPSVWGIRILSVLLCSSIFFFRFIAAATTWRCLFQMWLQILLTPQYS